MVPCVSKSTMGREPVISTQQTKAPLVKKATCLLSGHNNLINPDQLIYGMHLGQVVHEILGHRFKEPDFLEIAVLDPNRWRSQKDGLIES